MPWFLSPSGWPNYALEGSLYAQTLIDRGWPIIAESQVQAAIDAYNASQPPPPPLSADDIVQEPDVFEAGGAFLLGKMPAGVATDAEVAAGYVPLSQADLEYLTPETASVTYVPLSQRGAASGVATLDAGSKVPVVQVPDLSATYTQVANLPINVAEKYGRDDTAVRAAFAAAASTGRPLYFNYGDFTITGNLTVTTRVALFGDGYSSRLLFTDGGLIFDCTAATVTHTRVRGLRIRRIGTVAGPAVHLKGQGTNGLARFLFDDVHMSSPAGPGGGGVANAGDACLIEGCYLGTFKFCNFEESQYGIRGILESTSATGVNAIVFLGGESNGNQFGWDFQRATGVSFIGFTTEGNYARGGLVREVSRGFVYIGGYFELNVGPDIEVDCNAGGGGIVVQGNFFACGGAAKTESILLKRGRVNISNNNWTGLVEAEGDVAIRVSETTSPVAGEARNNMREDDGTIVAYTAGGVAFNVTQLGQVTKASSTVLSSALNEQAGVSFVRKVSQALDFASIPANSEATMTVTVTGAVVGDDCSVSSSILEAGLSLKSWGVTAADTVSICLRNNTAVAIDPAARTYRVRVWR